MKVCQQFCITLSVRGVRAWFSWEIKNADLCGNSLLRDHMLYTLEGARSLGGSSIKLQSQLFIGQFCSWISQDSHSSYFSLIPRKTVLQRRVHPSANPTTCTPENWAAGRVNEEIKDSTVVLALANRIRCKTCSFAATLICMYVKRQRLIGIR